MNLELEVELLNGLEPAQAALRAKSGLIPPSLGLVSTLIYRRELALGSGYVSGIQNPPPYPTSMRYLRWILYTGPPEANTCTLLYILRRGDG